MKPNQNWAHQSTTHYSSTLLDIWRCFPSISRNVGPRWAQVFRACHDTSNPGALAADLRAALEKDIRLARRSKRQLVTCHESWAFFLVVGGCWWMLVAFQPIWNICDFLVRQCPVCLMDCFLWGSAQYCKCQPQKRGLALHTQPTMHLLRQQKCIHISTSKDWPGD
jgi:hypothetical protein